MTVLARGSWPRSTHRFSVMRAGAPSTAGRLAAASISALVLAHLHLASRPATLCPLRALTGIPCPLCGGTTAAVRLGHFNLIGALAANPVAVFGGIGVVAAPLILGPGGLDRLSFAEGRILTRAVIAALVFSEVWQLIRFGVW